MENLEKEIVDQLDQLKSELSEVSKIDNPTEALIKENKILAEYFDKIYKIVEPKDFVSGLFKKGEEGIKKQLPSFPFRDSLITSVMTQLIPLKNKAIIIKNSLKEHSSKDEEGIRKELQKIIDKHEGK